MKYCCNQTFTECLLKVLLSTIKDFIGNLFCLYFHCFTCFVIIDIGKTKIATQNVLKFMTLTLKYIATVISTCTYPCDTNTFTCNLARIHLFQLKTHNI